jgi:hypothetical protein
MPQIVTVHSYRLRAEMFRPFYLLFKLGGYGTGKFIYLFIYFSNKAYDRILYVVYDSVQKTLKTTQY